MFDKLSEEEKNKYLKLAHKEKLEYEIKKEEFKKSKKK